MMYLDTSVAISAVKLSRGSGFQPRLFVARAESRLEAAPTQRPIARQLNGIGVAIALFVPEAKTASVEPWFAGCSDPIVAADWIVTEFASALSLKERRGEISAEAAQAVWSEFGFFRGAGLRVVPVSRKAFEDADFRRSPRGTPTSVGISGPADLSPQAGLGVGGRSFARIGPAWRGAG